MNLEGARRPLAVLALVCYSGHAAAEDRVTAEALFRAGREAVASGDNLVACERFHESYRLDPAAGTLLNIASCEEALGHLAAAWENYQHLADRLPSSDDRLTLVNEKLAALDVRLPRLTLRTDAKTPSADVRRDGGSLKPASLGVPLPVDPGVHRITVVAVRRQVREYIVQIDEGQRLTIDVEPGPPTDAAPPSATLTAGATPQANQPSFRADAAYVLLGVGAAGLVGAGLTGAFYLDARSTTSDHCPSASSCDDVGLKAAGTADALQTATIVAASIGVVALATGITLWIFDRNDRRLSRSRSRQTAGVGLLRPQFSF